MLKLRKIFSLGLTVAAVAALGLMVASCVEPVDYYSVEVWTGDVETGEYVETARPGSSGAGSSYEEGAVVDIKAGTPPTGKVFYQWTSAQVVFADSFSSNTSFTMPAKDVIVTAWFKDAAVSEPQVRYTWEAAQLPNIHMISASYDDVDAWYSDVYSQYDNLPDVDAFLHISHRPFGEGSDLVPDGLYTNFTMGTVYDTKYKGVYFPIDEGNNYTAICTVIDPVMKDTFDIVANYSIKVNGGKSYFEVGFDVGLFLEGDYDNPDLWIITDAYTNGNTKQRLEKSKTKPAKFLKKLKKDDVTYYVFRRASK